MGAPKIRSYILTFVLFVVILGYGIITPIMPFYIDTIALQGPALTALTSKRASAAQGVAMGLSNSLVSLGRIVGPLFGGLAFDVNVYLPYPGGSAIMGLSSAVSVLALRRPNETASPTVPEIF